MREINEIIIHTFATKQGWMSGQPFAAKVAEVKKWHLARGFSDVGYHFLVSREGQVIEGRPLRVQGAHTRGHNDNSIGISLEGGFGHTRFDKFEDVYTVKQGRALRKLLAKLSADGPLTISPHNKYANKECPAFDLGDWLNIYPQPDMAEVVKDFENVTFETTTAPPKPAKGKAIAVVATGFIGAIALLWDKLEAFIGGLF